MSSKTFSEAPQHLLSRISPRRPPPRSALPSPGNPLLFLEHTALLRLARDSPKSSSRHEFLLFPAGPHLCSVKPRKDTDDVKERK